MKNLTSHSLVVLAVLLAVSPGVSVEQQRTEEVVTDSPNDIVAIVDHIAAGQERVLNRLLVVLMISIAFFFVCLLGYRYVTPKNRVL